jgi:glyoxylase-like metal-dependent hydrolase (beta-lactamase superfamily II)
MIALEDNFADVLGKALRGQHLTAAAVGRKSGLAEKDIANLLAGEFEEKSARVLAGALHLSPEALVRLARGEHVPAVECPASVVVITTPFDGMTVNAYILWDRENRAAAIFDTGADAAPLLAAVERLELDVAAIFLTHSHADHVQALSVLQRRLGVDAWSSESEPVRGTKNFRPGDLFSAGRYFIRTRLTPGHSPGGTTFVIEGPVLTAAIVGDALFAGSVGGVREDYDATLATIRREILSLPDNTILCPGHGPLTTVGLEKAGNPFFAA